MIEAVYVSRIVMLLSTSSSSSVLGTLMSLSKQLQFSTTHQTSQPLTIIVGDDKLLYRLRRHRRHQSREETCNVSIT